MSIDVGKTIADSVRKCRNRLSLSQEQVAERLGIPRSAVSEIESGRREVSATELVTLGTLFGVSVADLLDMGPEAPSNEADEMMYRTAALPAGVEVQLKHWRLACQSFQQLESEVGDPSPSDLRPVTRVLSSFEEVDELADEERDRLKLGATPAHTLMGVIEDQLRIKVLYRDLEDGLSGASMVSQQFGPAMLVNSRHSPGRRVFTLAHELFHLLVRGPVERVGQPRAWHVCDGKVADKKDRIEQFADRFAGRLLVPPGPFLERLRILVKPGTDADHSDLIAVARHFGVSVQAIFVQLAVHRLAPWELALKGYQDPVVQQSIVDAGPEVEQEPQRFRRLAIKAFLTKRISRGRLAELLEINVAEVEWLLRRHGGGGADHAVRIALPR